MSASGKERADILLVDQGLCASRARAQQEIRAGTVYADGIPVAKPGLLLDVSTSLKIRDAAIPYVSRGGLKLAAALDHFNIKVEGAHALDIGASTGGFTDVLLRRGAAHVTAVDVGTGQFHPSLGGDPRVTLLEQTDARALTAEALGTRPDLMVVDVSFISLQLVLPVVMPLAAPRASLVALIKPQFEVGRARVGKGGIVRDPAVRQAAADGIVVLVRAQSGWHVDGVIESPIEGGDGNQEFLLAAQKSAAG